jgi:hypothetical protein
MKSKLLCTAMIALFITCFTGRALADFSYYITSDYTPGNAQVSFYLYFETDETVRFLPNTYIDSNGNTVSLKAFSNLKAVYDFNELDFVSLTRTPFGDDRSYSPGTVKEATGSILYLDAKTNRAFYDVSAGVYLLDTFTFNVLNAVADGEPDFNFDYAVGKLSWFITDDLGWVRSDTTENWTDYVVPSTIDIGASPVPVPAAVWLLGSGIAGLACLRRRTRR